MAQLLTVLEQFKAEEKVKIEFWGSFTKPCPSTDLFSDLLKYFFYVLPAVIKCLAPKADLA